MDNVEEMDKFLEKYNFPKLDQEEIENLNRPITSTEIETVIKNLPANKSPREVLPWHRKRPQERGAAAREAKFRYPRSRDPLLFGDAPYRPCGHPPCNKRSRAYTRRRWQARWGYSPRDIPPCGRSASQNP